MRCKENQAIHIRTSHVGYTVIVLAPKSFAIKSRPKPVTEIGS